MVIVYVLDWNMRMEGFERNVFKKKNVIDMLFDVL